jgi:HEAT repeat protein
MAKLLDIIKPYALATALALSIVGCHADPDDAAGQAGELSDPVRREYALGNLTRLFGKALTEAKSDRTAAPVKAFSDATVDNLVKTYVEHPEDTQNGQLIMSLLFEMREPRSLPALLKALEWRTEVNEEHAVMAARTIAVLNVPADKRTEVTKKLAEALDRVTGKRPVDNRMRIEFLRALGELNDKAASEVLTKVALRQSEEQSFLINNLAVEQIGRLADPDSVPALIEALYLFDPADPRNRLNQAVPAALVRIGRPALDPLLKVLKGENPKSIAQSKAYIEAIRKRAPQIAAAMDPVVETKKEAAYALGVLGFREAIDPLIDATDDKDKSVQLAAAVALATINREPGDTERIRTTMLHVYGEQDKIQRMQMLRAMQHLYDPELQGHFLEVAKAPEEELPDIRVIAFNSFCLLADKQNAQAGTDFLRTDKSPYASTFEKQNLALLKAATECDNDIACWAKKLDDKDEEIARKATYMLARNGQGNPTAVAALVAKLDHHKEMVRGDVLSALDFVATKGSKEAVAKIEVIRKAEEGRAIWNHVKERALATQAKLMARGG